MKLTFNQTANGTYELEFKVSTDFNLHVERTDASQDLYVYYRGSSEGEYKFYKKYYGKVVDEDINIVDNIVPKFFKVKSASNPVLCEVTGEVEVVIGGEDKPEGGGDSRDPQVQLEEAYDNSGDWEYSYHTVKLLEASDGPLGGATLSTDEDGMKVLTFNKYDLPRGYASFKIHPCVNVKVTEYNSDGIVGEMVRDDVFMNGVSIYQGRYFYIEDTVTGYKYKAQIV